MDLGRYCRTYRLEYDFCILGRQCFVLVILPLTAASTPYQYFSPSIPEILVKVLKMTFSHPSPFS